MMPLDFRIAAITAGALLVLGALLAGRMPAKTLRGTAGTVVRTAAGAAGAALLLWVGASFMSRPTHSAPLPAAATAPPLASSPDDLIGAASAAIEECPLATAPTLPDGATASLQQMIAARTAFQAYDGATNSYVQCVDSTVARIAKQSTSSASPADLESLQTFATRAHDTAVDQEQAVADQLNSQIRAFKAKHPKS